MELEDVAQDHLSACGRVCDFSVLPGLTAPAWLSKLGVPEDHLEDAFDHWTGWTGGMLRRAWHGIAAAVEVSPETLLTQASAAWRQHLADARDRVRSCQQAVSDLRRQVEEWDRLSQQARLLPDEQALATATRYESHVSRQMLQALHTLERLQAARAGLSVTPPAVLDITVETSEGDAGGCRDGDKGFAWPPVEGVA